MIMILFMRRRLVAKMLKAELKKEFEEWQAQRKAKQLNSQIKDIEKKSR